MARGTLATALASATLALGAAADYQDDWGPAVGTTMLAIEAADQSGTVRDLASLKGERGVVLFMVRSADW
ncbi:MAG: hypothetical protein OXH15_07235 [Gammaproteobacteria bacterium]|nr:hypothetical protein [Gammaproteobacteria bacterium]